jgi:hypothetical protein
MSDVEKFHRLHKPAPSAPVNQQESKEKQDEGNEKKK